MTKLLWKQKVNAELTRIREPFLDSALTEKKGDLEEYTGRYKLNAYKIATIQVENNNLTIQMTGESKLALSFLSEDKFTFKTNDFQVFFGFIRDKKNSIQKMKLTRTGAVDVIKISSITVDSLYTTHGSNRQFGFTRSDTLRGMLTPLRTCYDVLFYNLQVTVDPETKSIRGNNIIRFKTIQSFDKIQVDLYANMKIEKILFHELQLSNTREFNAVFIQFPSLISTGSEEEINIFYSGTPQPPDPATLTGGFLWFQDNNGKLWMETVCQGSGASLWWPCKDHLYDKPDSMKVSVTIPKGLMEISNGRLQHKTDLPGNLTRFDWYVSYPINNYDVVLNIGDYAHFSDLFISKGDTLTLNYYCMPYNIEKAKQIFKHVKPMLDLYEKDFGKYPFKRDGFTLMESLYPMEHQGAVSMGPINNPIQSDKYDSADLIRTSWHESAHEWWGNSVTCKDMADLWIHEAFATYSEVLNYETFYSKAAALKYLKNDMPQNREPIIGVYNVNDFHLGDMYIKGALMLHTLRNIIDNDSVWFSMLRGIQQNFKYKSITTEDIILYINGFTKKDYTRFFDQYLRHAAIPMLSLIFKNEGSSLQVQYKWDVDVIGFDMPVKVTTAKNSFAFIYPNSGWQTLSLSNMKSKDFKVDTDDFYIGVKKE